MGGITVLGPLWHLITQRDIEVVTAATAVAAPAVLPATGAVEPGSFLVYGAMGVIAGTSWRIRYWFHEKTGWHKRTVVEDTTAILPILVLTFGACDYATLTGWSASLAGLFVSILGIEPFRKAAILMLDTFAKNWPGGRNGVGPNVTDPNMGTESELSNTDGDRHDP